MAIDGVVYFLTQPFGLVLILLALALPFLLWRVVLSEAFVQIGFVPLVAGYIAALLSLVVGCFWYSYMEFSTRASAGLLLETQRWSIVPGWTLYTAILYLTVVLPLLGIIGVPWSASLLKRKQLCFRKIVSTIIFIWLGVTMAVSFIMLAINGWNQTHLSEFFIIAFKDTLPSVALVGLPFLLGIYWVSRVRRNYYCGA